ncbi:protein AKNAD1 isoform X2 [Danio rerio]|uniref:Protein AKNAD1 isoform X2 n=2 Tax=Danio rerio TaxID=7955 RepID=A0AC58HVI5_DANRE
MNRGARKTRTSARSSRFDGYSTGESEDMDGEDEAHSRPSSVLWERHIEQSIFVDISDDDSLHFSDMEGAFNVQLLQGSGVPESPQLTDDAEQSESCETEEGSSETLESVSSEHTEHSNPGKRRGNITKAPMQKLSTTVKPVIATHEDDAVNTSDEEHEDLPYDGAHKTEINLKSTPCETVTPRQTLDKFNMQIGHAEETVACQSNLTHALPSNHKAADGLAPPVTTPTQPSDRISDLLLRHFSKEELLNSSRIIEAETLPEMSLMESIDETVLSKASQICIGDMEKIQDVIEETDPAESHELVEEGISNESSSPKEPVMSCISDAALVMDEDKDDYKEQSRSTNSLDLSNADAMKPKFSFSRSRSYGELKYGQGKVHYPLPDFSKVAPKVKIPKGNGSVKPVSQSLAMAQTQSSPGKSGSSCKATVDVISRVLEDSIMPPENVFADKKVAHQLQVEYDRLLAKYTEDENLIGQQIHSSSEPSVTIDWNEATNNTDNTKLTANNPQAPTTGPTEKQFSLQGSQPVETESQSLTDGERLTSELRDIIRSFIEKVDEFKMCVTTMSMNVEEQQMVLKSMMEAQDQLERNYLTKRDEHRALEMQNYRGLGRNTGQFDPDREVEGQIFRIGMYLEDIKEQIDRNVCQVFYPPSSSSTPSPPPCEDIPLSSSLPSLHEEPLFSISSDRHNMEDNSDEEANKDHAADEPLSSYTENSFQLKYSTFATETPGTANEKEEDRPSTAEKQNYEDVLAQPSGSASLKQLTHERYKEKARPSEASFSSAGPSAGSSPQPNTDKTQIFFSPETDSGFGSFDLSRPNTGLSQTSPSAVSSVLSDDVVIMASVNSSDSEASHSNARTTISMAPRPAQPTVNHLEYKQQDTQAMQAKSIIQNGHVRASKKDLTSVGGATAAHNQLTERKVENGLTKETHSPSHCSCHNNEVILSLQYEVSRLKRALEESLGHLSKRTDYPSSRCHLERKHRGQTRGHNRVTSSRRVKDSNFQKTEDWISSDKELSKSKVSNGEDSDHTLSFQRAFSSSNGQIHDSRVAPRASVERFPLEVSQFSQSGSHRRASVGPTIHSIKTEPANKSASYRPAMGNLGNDFFNSTTLASTLNAPSHKPLLQVNYGLSYSLPAGFKLRDRSSDPVSSRRRSVESDSALLPSNVFFQRTSPRTSARRHRTSREESIHKTLDKALQAAFLMKQTTDRMADALSADLAKAQLQRKLNGLHPLNSRADT